MLENRVKNQAMTVYQFGLYLLLCAACWSLVAGNLCTNILSIALQHEPSIRTVFFRHRRKV